MLGGKYIMKTYIALLRGINVSGQKKVPMVELRNLLSGVGFNNVQTYIQSGNVVFESLEGNSQKLETDIQKAIKSHFDFEVPVLVKTGGQLKDILSKTPFSVEKTEKSYFTLLHQKPDDTLVEDVKSLNYPNEEFFITDECVYFFSTTGYGNAKCNNNFFERKLKVGATTRNYKTMVKLLSLCSD